MQIVRTIVIGTSLIGAPLLADAPAQPKPQPRPAAQKAPTADTLNILNTSDLKILFVDSFAAMRECEEGRKVIADVEKKREEYAKSLETQERTIAKEFGDFKNKSAALAPAAREKEEQRLTKLRRDYEERVQEYETELKAYVQRNTEQLVQAVEKEISSLAQQRGLDAVLDTTTGRVIYITERANMTNVLVGRLNQDHNLRLAANDNAATKGTSRATA